MSPTLKAQCRQQPTTTSIIDSLPTKIFHEILEILPLEAKKVGRRVCKEWNFLISQNLDFKVPNLSDVTIRTIAGTHMDVSSLEVQTLVLNIPETLQFINGHRVRTLTLIDPDISEQNLIWIFTKCYSIKEVRILQGSGNLIEFLGSKEIRVLNMASRTLKSLQIIGNPSTHSMMSPNPTFDCSILRDCASLHSFIIIQFPFLELKHIQLLPTSLAYLALEEDLKIKSINNCLIAEEDEKSKVNANNNKCLVGMGFIDFSSPYPLEVKTFQYVIRLTRLKRHIANPLHGQKLLELCPSNFRFRTIWNEELNQYQLTSKYINPSQNE